MKILKPAKKKKALRCTCSECRCRFEFTEKEAKYEPGGPRPDDGDFYRVKCPACKTENIVYPK